MKSTRVLSFVLFMCAIFCPCVQQVLQAKVNIIPLPVEMKTEQGFFKLTPKTTLNIVKGSEDLQYACDFFRQAHA